MIDRCLASLMLAFLPSVALAQTPPSPPQPAADPAFLQRMLSATTAQRDQAETTSAALQARAEGLQDDIVKASGKIAAAEAKSADLDKKFNEQKSRADGLQDQLDKAQQHVKELETQLALRPPRD